MAQRPTAVTVFGILNIIFGVFGVIGIAASSVILSVGQSGSNPTLDMMHTGVAGAWTKISMVLGCIAAVVEIISGIGLLQLQAWGRKMAIGFAAYTIAAAVIGTFINIFFVVTPLLAEAGRTTDPTLKAGAIGGAIGGVIGSCGGLLYPAILLFFMTRPEVAAAFAPPTSSAPPHSAVPPSMPPGEQAPHEQPFNNQSF